MQDPGVIYTIGHSTHTIDEFVELLRHYGIEQLIDIRTVPRSRHNPQYNKETLGPALRRRRIGYRHMKGLGGLRRARPDSLNGGWRNPSFRGFADYMQSAEFIESLTALVQISVEKCTAIMCAEAVPWRCHRSLIGDALVIRGMEVWDIYSLTSVRIHKITGFAQVDGMRITYPGGLSGEMKGE